MRAIFIFRDGTFVDAEAPSDPQVTVVQLHGRDGVRHEFRPTEEIDSDGRDVWREVEAASE